MDAELSPGVKAAAEANRKRQQPHLAALNADRIAKGKFEEAWFVCQLVEFSHSRSGDVLVKIRVPYLYRDQPSLLKDAYGMMLQCHMTPWSQAEEARRASED